MPTNPLMERQMGLAVPTEQRERVRFWIERGNRVLWGEEPTKRGEYLEPRRDLEWVWRNGSYLIQPRFMAPRDGEITQNS